MLRPTNARATIPPLLLTYELVWSVASLLQLLLPDPGRALRAARQELGESDIDIDRLLAQFALVTLSLELHSSVPIRTCVCVAFAPRYRACNHPYAYGGGMEN
jgi:hypothetical protein